MYGLCLTRAVAESGVVIATIPTLGSEPTNVAFDPVGRLGLAVTEAECGLLLRYPQTGRDENL